MGVLLTLVPVFALAGCPSSTPNRDIKLSRTHFLLGSDYLKKKNPHGAKRELLRALELDFENKDASQLLGVIFFMEGLQKMNILERQRCLKGIEAEEQRREANDDFRRCEKYIRSAVKLAEREKQIESDGLNYLANVSLHFKRYDQAISRAQKALKNILYVPRHLPLGTLGWAYYHKGDLTAAARELRQAIYHEPQFCVGRYRLAKVYFDQKRYDQAIQELEQVIQNRDCPIQEAHQLLGLAYMKKREMEKAHEQFNACVRLNPQSCVSEECQRYAKLM